MKRQTFWKLGLLGLALAALPLAGGWIQPNAESAPVAASVTDDESVAELTTITNAPPPEQAENDLENAGGQLVSAPKPPVSGPAADIAKLAQAGVDESVMLSYVTNSPRVFDLSADDIVYLNDIGVPGTVVTAIIQHDQTVRGSAPDQSAATAPPAESDVNAGAQVETPPPGIESNEAQPAVEAPLTPPAGNVASSYFYDSLAPYGSWVNIDGYGMCWRPTVTVVNPGWQPYSDNGYWVYSDSGWYWASDYSWGWAPFHYGRWFHHRNWGWCWAPDTVWGPAWVSWRYTDNYCGWAPLPPTACYVPGVGFTYFGHSVGFGFSFGLGWNHFTFVSVGDFSDRHWHRHRLPPREIHDVFNRTEIHNRIVVRNRTIVNEGIPVTRVAAATHREIPQHHIREAGDPRSARLERRDNDRSLAVYRPNLPSPTRRSNLVGQGVKLDTRAVERIHHDERAAQVSGSTRIGHQPAIEGSPKSPFDARTANPREQRNNRAAIPENRRAVLPNTERNDSVRANASAAAPRTEKPDSTSRGSDRNLNSGNRQNPPNSIILRGNHDNRDNARPAEPQSNQPRIAPQPRQPIQNNRPSDSRGARNPERQSFAAPAPQAQAPVVTAPLTPRARDQAAFDRQNDRVFRQDQRQFSQPAPQTQWRQPAPQYQAPAVQPREQSGWNMRQSRAEAPMMRSQPSVPRQAPVQSAPARQQDSGGGHGDRGGHRNR